MTKLKPERFCIRNDKEYGALYYNFPYSITETYKNGVKTGQNCADLCYGIGKAGDVFITKPKDYIWFVGLFTKPDLQYDQFVNNNPNGQTLR